MVAYAERKELVETRANYAHLTDEWTQLLFGTVDLPVGREREIATLWCCRVRRTRLLPSRRIPVIYIPKMSIPFLGVESDRKQETAT